MRGDPKRMEVGRGRAGSKSSTPVRRLRFGCPKMRAELCLRTPTSPGGRWPHGRIEGHLGTFPEAVTGYRENLHDQIVRNEARLAVSCHPGPPPHRRNGDVA